MLRRLALALGLASFTALVLGLALAATMPAQVAATLVRLPPQVEGLAGSLWHGRATLAGGHALEWRLSLREAWRGRLLADATLDGPDTLLEGTVALAPLSVAAEGWNGRAGPGLLALGPRLIVTTCTPRAVVDVARLAWGRGFSAAEGRVETPAGTCDLRRGGTLDVPALRLDLSTDGADAHAALTAAEAGTPLAALTVTGDRRLLVRVEPEGARLVPGMPASAPTELELPF